MSQNDFKINNPSANQILVYSEIQKAFINVEPGQGGSNGAVEDGVNIGGGTAIFNDTQSGVMRFKTFTSTNGITIENNGSNIQIGFDGDASTLGGLGKDGYLHVSKNLLDVDDVEARKNLKVYSINEIDDGFLEANATNIPDVDNAYDLGSNGRRFADIYAVTFRGTATNAILSQDIEQKGAEDGQVLTWDSQEKEWLPKDGLSSRLGDLIDVDLSNVGNESVIVFNASRNIWEALPLSSLGTGTGSDGSTSGSITDAENVGGGIGTFFTRFGGNLQFRSISGGSNVSVTTNFNNEEIVINADVPQSTDDLTEGTNNLYFTEQRVRNVLSDVSIQDLGDMPASGPTANQGPVWNGTQWEFRDLAVGITTTDDLPEGMSNFYFTQNRAFDAIDEYLLDSARGVTLQELKDTNVSLSAGTYLYNDGSRWVNRAIQMSDISDINLTGLSDGSALVYNATNSRFEVGVLPQRLIDLQETTDSLHFTQESFDTFFGNKNADDLSESANRKFLNTTNLNNVLSTVSIGSMRDVDLTNIADNSVLVWDSAQSAFVTADSSSLNVTVDMGIEDLNNVSESSVVNAQNGYSLQYNGTTGEFEAQDPTQNLVDLGDVTASSIQSGQVLVYQSGNFLPASLIPYDPSVSPTDGAILQFDSTSGKYVSTTASGLGVSELGHLSDVTLTSLANEQVLVYDNTLGDFVNRDISEVVGIESIGGVSLSNVQTNDALIYDGVNFVNVAYPNFDLQSLVGGDLVQYNQTSGKFESISPYEALNINYQTPSSGSVFVYNDTTGEFDVKTLNVSDLGDVNPPQTTKVSGAPYGLVWDEVVSQFNLMNIESIIGVESLSNVSVVDQVDGATLSYDSASGLYEIRQASITDNRDVTTNALEDGNALVWDSTANEGAGAFVNGTPDISLQELNNVSVALPQDGEGIVWSEADGTYTSVKLDISYESVIKNSNALEFWNFDTTLTGSIQSIDLVADAGYNEYSVSAVGIKGSPSAEAGTSYDPTTESVADMLRADIKTLTLEESKTFSYDFWFQPSSAVTYNTAQKDSTIVASLGVRANTLGDSIAIQILIEPTDVGHEHHIALVKNGITLNSVPLTLNTDSFNYIVANYTKGTSATTVTYAVNGTEMPAINANDLLGDDSDNTLFVEALGELESGSQPYRVDNLAVYDQTQPKTIIETKYKNVVSTGFTYTVPSIFSLGAVEVSNVTQGDVLRYDGVNFVNGPGVESISDLSDVDISSIGSGGEVLQWDGTRFLPTLLNIPSTIQELSNVDTTGITSGQVLQWDGARFVAATVSGSGATQLTELSDVTITSPVDNQFIRYNGTEFVNETVSLVSVSGDLADVDTTGITSGQVLQWDGTQFVPATVSGSGATQLSELSDVDSSITPVDGQVLVFNGTSGFFEARDNTGGSVSTLNDLSDVVINTPTSGEFVRYDGSSFVNAAVDIPTAIEDLSNVDTTGITSGQVLQWDGTQFVAGTVSGSGATQLTELSDVTITSPVDNQFIRYNGTEFVNETVSLVSVSGDLADVDTTGITSGQVLQWDGSQFVPVTVNTSGVTQLSDLSDVDAAMIPNDGQALIYNSGTGQFEAQDITDQVGATALNELSDVNIAAPSTGDFVRYNGTEFVNESVSIPAAANDLTDIDTTGATTGDILEFNGTSFVVATYDLSKLGNLSLSGASDGQALIYNSSTGQFEAQDIAAGGASTLNELSDVTITSPVSSQFIRYDGTNFVNETVNIPTAIEDLSNVDTSGITSGQVLQWDGTQFVPYTISDQVGATSLNELSDVSIATPSVGDFVRYDGSSFVNESVTIPAAIEDLSNVDTSGVSDGDVLVYNSTSGAFEAGTVSGGSGATQLSELSDVDTSGVADGDVLVYDTASSSFKPAPMPSGGSGNYEWVEFLYTSGSGGTLGATDAIQSKTANININIVDGPNGIIEFTFVGKKYPPVAIMSYGQAASSNEFLIRSIYNYGTKLTTDDGTSASPALFNGNFTETITLELTMAVTGASAGFGQRAHLYVLFAFGE